MKIVLAFKTVDLFGEGRSGGGCGITVEKKNFQSVRRNFSITASSRIPTKQRLKITTTAGLEPARAKPKRFQVFLPTARTSCQIRRF